MVMSLFLSSKLLAMNTDTEIYCGLARIAGEYEQWTPLENLEIAEVQAPWYKRLPVKFEQSSDPPRLSSCNFVVSGACEFTHAVYFDTPEEGSPLILMELDPLPIRISSGEMQILGPSLVTK